MISDVTQTSFLSPFEGGKGDDLLLRITYSYFNNSLKIEQIFPYLFICKPKYLNLR